VEGVRAQSAPKDIDAYIVVTKSITEDDSTKQRYYGLGIADHAGLGHRFDLHVLYEIEVVNGHDLSVVNSTRTLLTRRTVLAMQAANRWRRVDESWMPATLDPAQNIRLKGAVTEMLDRSLPVMIKSLGLLLQ
jgi:hypothetical protein